MKKLLIVFLATLIVNSIYAGGPWPQKKGNGYFKLSQWWIVFDKHFTDSGLTDPNITTGIFNTNFYAEYGFTDRLTGVLNANPFSRNYMNNLLSGTTGEVLIPGEALNSIGDSELGLKYGFTKPESPIQIAGTVMFGIPLGTAAAGEQGNLQTGDGEFNQILQVDLGTGYKLSENINGYVSAYGGFNNRTNGFSDEIRFGLETGVGLLDQKLWLVGRLYGVESLKNGETSGGVTSTSIFANNSEYTSYSLEVNYYLTKQLGVSVNVASAFRGEIIAASPSYSVGVFLDLKK